MVLQLRSYLPTVHFFCRTVQIFSGLYRSHFTSHLSRSLVDNSCTIRQIAKAFKSAHTKTTCIVNGALQPHFAKPAEKLCQENPLFVLCDTDNKSAKRKEEIRNFHEFTEIKS